MPRVASRQKRDAEFSYDCHLGFCSRRSDLCLDFTDCLPHTREALGLCFRLRRWNGTELEKRVCLLRISRSDTNFKLKDICFRTSHKQSPKPESHSSASCGSYATDQNSRPYIGVETGEASTYAAWHSLRAIYDALELHIPHTTSGRIGFATISLKFRSKWSASHYASTSSHIDIRCSCEAAKTFCQKSKGTAMFVLPRMLYTWTNRLLLSQTILEGEFQLEIEAAEREFTTSRINCRCWRSER